MLGTEEDPLWTVAAGWSSSRPVRPDEHVSGLTLRAANEAALVGAVDSWLASRPTPWWLPAWEMTTSVRVLEVEL